MAHNTSPETNKWQVRVRFYVGSEAIVARVSNQQSAEKEARAYLSDSLGIWIIAPDGTITTFKALSQF
jgi:hypothetical protein